MKPVYIEYSPEEETINFTPDERIVSNSVDTFNYFAFPIPEDINVNDDDEVIDYLRENKDAFSDACRWREEYGLAIEQIYYLIGGETMETTEEFVCFSTHDEGVGGGFDYQSYYIGVEAHGLFDSVSNDNPPRDISGPSNVIVRCSEISEWMENIHFAYYKPTVLESISGKASFDDCKQLSNWRSCSSCQKQPDYETIDDLLVYSEDGLYCSDCV